MTGEKKLKRGLKDISPLFSERPKSPENVSPKAKHSRKTSRQILKEMWNKSKLEKKKTKVTKINKKR